MEDEGEKASDRGRKLKKLEKAEELDPLNAEMLEKIKKLRSKIESISRGCIRAER